MTDEELSNADERESDLSPSADDEQSRDELRHYVPADILDASFPVSVRGYDRRAVDAYLTRVHRAIAELQVSASPRAAVTHALEQTERQVSGLLQRARETAEEITASAREEAEADRALAKAELAELVVNVSAEAEATKAEAETTVANARTEAEDILVRSRLEAENTLAHARAEADESLRRSQEEIAALRDQAETQMRALQADTEAVRKERRQLLDEIRETATRLANLGEAAADRMLDELEAETLEPEAGDATKALGGAAGTSTQAVPASESRDAGVDESPAEVPETAAPR